MRRLAAVAIVSSLFALIGCNRGPAETTPGTPVASSTAVRSHGTRQPEAVPVTTVTPEELRRRIAADKGKVVLVDFWATWCVPCREQYPHTVELSKRHSGDLVVYSVSMDETDDETTGSVKAFLAKHSDGKVSALQSAQGGAEEAYTAFEITGGALPHYKVYGRDGGIAATFGGDVDSPIEPSAIDAAVETAIGK